jgi:riboflavin transporter FmnP
MEQTIKTKRVFTTSTLVKVGILSAIGYILMFISVPIPMLFPDFLKIDISDLTAVLGGIALGPVAGVTIEFLKNLLQFLTGMSTTGGVGEFANFIIGGSFVWIISFVYSKKKNVSGLMIGLLLGVVVMTIVGCISNYFIVLPFYSTIMPIEAVIEMGSKLNHLIVDKFTFVLFIIGPFNLLKAIIISLLTLPMYKRTEKILNKVK